MSSVERSYSAINSSNGFLVNVASLTPRTLGFTVASLDSALIANAATVQDLGTVANVISGTAATFIAAVQLGKTDVSNTPASAGANLYRDMGKTLYVQENGKNVLIYKLVQLVSGAASEGIASPQVASYYLPVWAAAGAGSTASLARTGY